MAFFNGLSAKPLSVGTAHEEFPVAYALDGGHLVGKGGEQTGLAHDGAYMEAGALIYVVLR